MNINEIMTKDVQTVSPLMDLVMVAQHMRDLDVGVIPVVENGKLLGIITDRDIVIRALASGGDPLTATVGTYMTTDPTTVSPDDDVQRAAEIMAREQIRRLPVVQGGTLVGIVSIGDVAVDVGKDRLVGEALEQISTPSKPERSS